MLKKTGGKEMKFRPQSLIVSSSYTLSINNLRFILTKENKAGYPVVMATTTTTLWQLNSKKIITKAI